MAATAYDDAKRFLFLHPTVTGDDPVQLLEQLVRERGVSQEHLAALRNELSVAKAKADKAEDNRKALIDFLKQLVYQRRLSNGKLREVLDQQKP